MSDVSTSGASDLVDGPGDGDVVVREFLVPDLGEGLESATIVEWRVDVGARVELNDTLCVVETAKAEVDLPSPFGGTLVERGGEDGDTLPVGAVLARIGVAGDRQPTLVGYGLDESIDRSRRRGRGATATPVVDVHAGVSRTRARARPPVRTLARSLGIDLTSVAPGSGPEGIVTRADVEHAAAAPAALTSSCSVVPVRGVRAAIAERMTASAAIPTATCAVTADATELLAARTAINDALERRGEPPVVSPFSLLCHLFVRVLAAHPSLNSTFVVGDPDRGEPPEIRVFEHVHLGVATATPRGLLVPVVRGAHDLGLVALATEVARLASAGRAGALTPAELQGSTVTVSNFGALGLDDGIPLINPPEAAILGVGAIRKRPWVVDDEVVARATVNLTLSFDHRVGDGAEAGELMGALRELIEAPILALA